MPTYVYACDSCGAQFEQFQSFKDEPIRTCPRCAGNVRRVFQPVGIVFKGSGWYITDSRKSSSASVNADKSGDKPGDKTSSDTAAESKPADTKPAEAASTSSDSKSSAPATTTP